MSPTIPGSGNSRSKIWWGHTELVYPRSYNTGNSHRIEAREGSRDRVLIGLECQAEELGMMQGYWGAMAVWGRGGIQPNQSVRIPLSGIWCWEQMGRESLEL